MNNAGKYALVTGASSGIGWQISEAQAKRTHASSTAVKGAPVIPESASTTTLSC